MRLSRLGLCTTLALTAALPALAEPVFNRIATFATPLNMAAGEDLARETSAEIISASPDGMTLIYTDSPLGVVGLIDITDPAAPKPLGNIDMGGEPTTAQIIGTAAYIGVNTSESFANPSGNVTTYSELAAAAGTPRAVRAVGTAVGRNPISFLIPCHRALRKSGGLGGYHWGLPVKRAMLAWEAARADVETV